MTRADASPLPGEPNCGRHRPERLFPLGLTPQRAVAHWAREHQRQALPHATHHGLEMTA